ncbi:hypothetical protein EBR57_04610 [bacterium]|nr:hypothetical protein [bacterium]
MRQVFRFGLSVFLCLVAFGQLGYGQSLSLIQTTVDKNYAPQSSKVAMIFFKIQAVGGSNALTSVSFKNSSPTIFFGNKVTKAFLYRDSSTAGVAGRFDDGDETELAAITYDTDPTTADQIFTGFSDTIASGNSQGYFVVYQIADNADLTATTSITLLDLNESNFDFGSNTVQNSVTITGLESKEITSIAPTVVIPGQTNVPILKIALKMSGEDMNESVIFKIQNIANNFVMDSNLKNGITAAYLYKGNVNQSEFDPEFIDNYNVVQQINAGSFTTTSSVTFSFPDKGDITIGTGVTTNLFVAYDIGDDFQVTNNTKVNGQVTSLTGLGDQSRLTVSIPSALPSQPASSKVAGLSYNTDFIKNLVNSNDLFGANSIVPIFEFEIRANQTDITIVTINIQNPGTVPFITTSSDPKNVQKISIYMDSNRDGVFNGFSSGGLDTLVADYNLGRGSNQIDRAVITMNALSSALTIPKFDSDADEVDGYNSNNAARFFTVYSFGQNILATGAGTGTGNSGAYSIARLENVVGTVNVSNNIYSVKLSGTRPVSANPEALVQLSDALDVFISSSQSLAPTMAIQGQVLVPMLYLTLDSASSFSSTNVSILNESSSFSPSNEGVSKVWIYRDVNGNKVVDSADTLLGVQDKPQTTSTASISAVSLFTGRNNWIILYNIGTNAPFPSNGIANIRAQFGGLKSTSNITVGGQSLPFPSTAASLTPSSSRLVISDVTTSVGTTATVVKDFTVGMTLSNLSGSDITVTDLSPRIYFSTISGTDISYEFTLTPDSEPPYIVPANGTLTVTFAGTHSIRLSDGNVLVDGYAEYIVPDSIYPVSATAGIAELVRYVGNSGFVPAFSNPPRFKVGKGTIYSWSFPAYISAVTLVVNENSIPFANFDAIPKQSELRIALVNSGKNIDESSIVVKINGVALTKVQSVSGRSGRRIQSARTKAALEYAYDSESGVIIIQDMGTSGGTLTIDADDLLGNPLDQTIIQFSISDVVKIENLYAYPSPYLRSALQPLNLGFDLTQPAKVKVYIFNHVGSLVFQQEYTYRDIGYHVISFGQNDGFMASGIYLCKMYATDDNGNKSNAFTRFAVY